MPNGDIGGPTVRMVRTVRTVRTVRIVRMVRGFGGSGVLDISKGQDRDE
jgi:hypothetical protein